jgi:hypothetical protein
MEFLKKWLWYLILGLFIGVLLIAKCSVVIPHPGEKDPALQALIDWLREKDPNVFKRCKVRFDENSFGNKVDREQEGIYTKITAAMCDNEGTFWVNNQAGTVDCYTSYCGAHIGNKYCADEIAKELCKQ